MKNIKKIKNEPQLLKKALELGERYAIKRGFHRFDNGVSPKDKVECIYRLLARDQLITPLAKDQENGPNMKHKLVLWIIRHLPEDDPLLH